MWRRWDREGKERREGYVGGYASGRPGFQRFLELLGNVQDLRAHSVHTTRITTLVHKQRNRAHRKATPTHVHHSQGARNQAHRWQGAPILRPTRKTHSPTTGRAQITSTGCVQAGAIVCTCGVSGCAWVRGCVGARVWGGGVGGGGGGGGEIGGGLCRRHHAPRYGGPTAGPIPGPCPVPAPAAAPAAAPDPEPAAAPAAAPDPEPAAAPAAAPDPEPAAAPAAVPAPAAAAAADAARMAAISLASSTA